MQTRIIKPAKRVVGTIRLPGDKSISHRAVMLGAIARGTTRVKGLLDCEDCERTIQAFRQMGIVITKARTLSLIEGKGLRGLKKPSAPIHAGDSGTTMRLLAGILAGQGFETTLTGGDSLSIRPMKRIIEPLALMGADISARGGEYPPLVIKGGRLNSVDYRMPVASAQVKSAVLLAGLYADGVTCVEEPFRSRDHTERMMRHFGVNVRSKGLKITLKCASELAGRTVEVPGDISSAAFFLAAAALLEGSRLKVEKVSVNPTRTGLLKVLSRMGADIRITNRGDLFEPVADIEVRHSKMKGVEIAEDMVPGIIDELPAIFVVAALSKGRTVIRGAGELKVKETDRINSMKGNLERMGAHMEVSGDVIAIDGPAALKGAELGSFGDHRTCMASAIAALCAKGASVIDGTECVSKSFPGFFKYLSKLAKR